LPEIDVKGLSFTYENRSEPALADVNLSIGSEEFVLVAGASGSGKSTLIKCINGLIPHRYVGSYSGEVAIRGKPVASSQFLELSLTVGTVLQETDKQLVGSKVEDDIAFGPCNLALTIPEVEERVTASMQSTGMEGLRGRSIFALSGGQKQRLAIADTLAMRPDIILFDEPLANLDSNGVRLMQEVFRELHRQHKTIIVSEHRTEEVLRAGPTRVVVIERGRVMADSGDPAVLIQFANVLKVPASYALRNESVRQDLLRATSAPAIAAPQGSPELIRVEDLSYEYRGGVRALDHVSFSIRDGERMAILGNNGAGKSTLSLNLVGILKPTSGRVLINGKDTRHMEVSEISKWVGLVFQDPFSMLFAKTVYDELAFGPKNIGMREGEVRSVVPEVAKQCLIDHLLDKSPFASSFGEKRRIGVGSILTMKPRCVILDEPTAGQDYRSYSHFMDFIGSLKGRVSASVVITHDPDLAIEYTDRAIVLGDGRVAADGPTREVLADPSILSACAIRETSLIELSREVTGGKSVLTLRQLAKALTRRGEG